MKLFYCFFIKNIKKLQTLKVTRKLWQWMRHFINDKNQKTFFPENKKWEK